MRSISVNRKDYGPSQRLSYQENELANAPIVPNPVEYEDIDTAFLDFFDQNIVLVDDDGKKFDTFTFFSNQRFSEYSQTWEHTDSDGNLLMNFFMIDRDTNPGAGTIQGGAFNIPGKNRFTVLMRDVVDDNGVECYEVTSMSQPLQINIKYCLGLVTAKIKYLNEFNTKAHSLFASKQCYLCVNGHYMPMVMENINDDSDYTIDSRKFYIQSIEITLSAYIIPKDDIKVELIPKRRKVTTNLKSIDRTFVSMDYDEDDENKIQLNINFNSGVSKVNFTLDDDMFLFFDSKTNANGIKMKINDDDVDINTKIRICSGDDISIKISQPNILKSSEIIFNGDII